VTQSSSEPVVVATPAPDRRATRLLVLRVLLGMAVLFAGVVLLVHTFRAELEGVGRAFVGHFGLAGMALGSFIADGFHFPVAPQFYMLLGIAGGNSHVTTFSAIAAGSLTGGVAGYVLARWLGRFPRLARWLERSSAKFRHHLQGRNAYRGVVIATCTPVPFSVLCYSAGLYRLSERAFLLILALRIPRLLVFYYLVWLGWSAL
jgi:membrane protein YqaA with SNARE-associated domain